MIPARLVAFINEEADMGVFGTRNADNVPRAHRLFGFKASDDGTQITAFFPHFSVEGLAEAIAANRRVAMTAGSNVTHETYQLKGLASAPVDPSEEDLAHFAEFHGRMVAAGVAYGLPEELLNTLVQPPVCTVTFVVEDLFLQTPGPGAGKRLSEVEDA